MVFASLPPTRSENQSRSCLQSSLIYLSRLKYKMCKKMRRWLGECEDLTASSNGGGGEEEEWDAIIQKLNAVDTPSKLFKLGTEVLSANHQPVLIVGLLKYGSQDFHYNKPLKSNCRFYFHDSIFLASVIRFGEQILNEIASNRSFYCQF